MKICNVCKKDKEFSEYKEKKNSVDGLTSICKVCLDLKNKHRSNRKEKLKESNRLYYQKNKKKHNEWCIEWGKRNKSKLAEHQKKYRENNPDNVKETRRKYREKNKERLKENSKLYSDKNRVKLRENNKQRKKDYPILKIKDRLRNRLWFYIKSNGLLKKESSEKLLGCSWDNLKEHIEKQFKDGMTWENHGKYGWHIDHIIPLSSGKSEDDLNKLCHYSNLQPLWWDDNLSKSNKIL